MQSAEFTSEEIDDFIDRFKRAPHWQTWTRQRSKAGLDVIEIVTGDEVEQVFKIAKVKPGQFAATGFGAWALTMSDDLGELLGLMCELSPPRRSLVDTWQRQSAA